MKALNSEIRCRVSGLVGSSLGLVEYDLGARVLSFGISGLGVHTNLQEECSWGFTDAVQTWYGKVSTQVQEEFHIAEKQGISFRP